MSSSLRLQHTGGSSAGELRGAERTAVMGGTTRSVVRFQLRDREVVLDGRVLRRKAVRSVTASAAGPSLVVLFVDGEEVRVDASDHPIEDIEWLARRMATILEVRSRAQVIESLDRMSLTLVAPDPDLATRDALLVHLAGLAFVGWMTLSVAIEAGGLAGRIGFVVGLLVMAAQLGDLLIWRNLQRTFVRDTPAEVSIAPDGLTVRDTTHGWSTIPSIRRSGRSLELTIGHEAHRLTAPDDLSSDDFDRAGTVISAFIDAFHSDEALEHEEAMRSDLRRLKGRRTKQT